MLTRFFLILTGLFAGLWLRSGDASAMTELGLPALTLLALVLAIAAAPRASRPDAGTRGTDAFRQWLDAWQRLRNAGERERAAAEEALASASNAVVLTASDRVVKALHAAAARNYELDAVVPLVFEMRRSGGRGSFTLKPADIEAVLAPAPRKPATSRVVPAAVANGASFLS